MQTIKLSAPANKEEQTLAQFARASEAIRKHKEAQKEQAGELRRSIADLRHTLLSVMGDATQVNVPVSEGAAPMYARLKSHRSAKSITDKVIEGACSVLSGVDRTEEGWRDLMLQMFTDKVREQVITKKVYVDIVDKPQKAGSGQTLAASPDDAATRIALELQRAKAEFRVLQDEQKRALDGPKQQLEELRELAFKQLEHAQVDKVRVKTAEGGAPDLLVTAKLTYKTPKLSMRSLKELVLATLQQCDENSKPEDIAARIQSVVKQHQIDAESKTEKETVSCDRAPSKHQ